MRFLLLQPSSTDPDDGEVPMHATVDAKMQMSLVPRITIIVHAIQETAARQCSATFFVTPNYYEYGVLRQAH